MNSPLNRWPFQQRVRPFLYALGTLCQSLLAPQDNLCHLCGALLGADEHFLCVACEKGLERCRIHPLEAVSRNEAVSALMLSAYWHTDEARTLIHRLKFGHDRIAAIPLAYGMAAAYGERLALFPPPWVVTAVPTHSSRQKTRGYNQAQVLAEAFCNITGLPFLPDALLRTRHSGSQIGHSRKERLTAMDGAFAAQRDQSGVRLLLVDDVLTTGATATACLQCLLEAGATEVALLTVCKA